jgi:tetratricopeptide (TPR) repeat protein
MSRPRIPKAAQRLARSAELHLLAGEFDQAERAIENALSSLSQSVRRLPRRPRNRVRLFEAGLHNQLGNLHRRRGDLTQAVESCRHALVIAEALAPNSLKAADILNTLGLVYCYMGDLTRALQYCEQALAIGRAVNPHSPTTALVLNSTALVLYYQESDAHRALACCKEALTASRKVAPDSLTTALVVNTVAFTLCDQGRLELALEFSKHALIICGRIAPRGLDFADCLSTVGYVLSDQGHYTQALEYYEKGLAISLAIAPRSLSTAELLTNIGAAYLELGDLRRALGYYWKAVATSQEMSPGSIFVARDLGNIGYVYAELGDLGRAQIFHELALAIDEGRHGSSDSELGDLERALDYHRRALEIDRQAAPDSLNVARDLTNLGAVHSELGDLERALDYHRRALEIDRQAAPNSLNVARDLTNLGVIYHDRGDLDRALDYHQQALAIDRQAAPNSLNVARDLTNLGVIYHDRGDLDRALDYYNRAVAIDRAVAPHSISTATDLSNIGYAYREMGDLEKALAYHREAFEIDQLLAPNSVAAAKDLSNIGLVYRERGDVDKAIEHYLRALEIDQICAPLSVNTAIDLANIAAAYHDRGDLERSLDYYSRSLDISKEVVPNSIQQAKHLAGVAHVYDDNGNREEAIRHALMAIDVVESLRSNAGERWAKGQVFAAHQMPYQSLISWLFSRGNEEDAASAFHYAERSRARILLELLTEREIEVSAKSSEDRKLFDFERHMQFQLATVYNKLRETRQDPAIATTLIDALANERRQLEDELDRLRRRIRVKIPAYAEIRYPEALSVDRVQQLLGDGTTLLLYETAASEAFVWCVRGTSFSMQKIECSVDRMAGLVEASLSAYYRGEQGGQAEYRAQQDLSRLLLDQIPGSTFDESPRLVVITGGPLSYLPFELLTRPDGMMLGDRHVISYAPSATAFANLHKMAVSRPPPCASNVFVGFGDPAPSCTREARPGSSVASRWFDIDETLSPLPGAADEVTTIARHFPGQAVTYLGERATEHRAKIGTEGYRYVHFATHGLLDDRNPLYSGLVLASPGGDDPVEAEDLDDFLQVYEMFGLRLSADVVVCSACETGLGRIERGEGLVGMSHALFFAGARCLVLSLWPVPDRPTVRLMDRFYDRLSHGVEPADALREAKISVRRSHPKTYRDPFTWAAFVAVGLGWNAK